MQYNPGLFELKRYIDSILRELEDFKREHGITVNCVTMEKDSAGNILSLRITLPKPDLYDAFMRRLASKNILPTHNINKEEEKTSYPQSKNRFALFTPLSTRPRFGSNNLDDEKEKIRLSSTRLRS